MPEGAEIITALELQTNRVLTKQATTRGKFIRASNKQHAVVWGTWLAPLFFASSTEFMGEFWLGKIAECVI